MSEQYICGYCGMELKSPGEYHDISTCAKYLHETKAEMCNEINALTARVAELEQAQRWIPVTERLPEVKNGDEKEYDVVLTYPFSREVIVGTWGYNAGDISCKRRWFDISDDYGREEVTEFVTHWRERPTPPEENGE